MAVALRKEISGIFCGFLLLTSFLSAEDKGVAGFSTKQDVLQFGRQVRTYTVSFPTDLDPKKPLPLLVAFHGYRGDVKTWMHEESSFPPLMAARPFIIVYPEGPIGWTPAPDSPDVEFFDALVIDLEKKYPIDRSRVYVLGHSNGAVFASYLLLIRPKVVAAAVAHSGLFPANRFPEGVTQSPLMVVWGEKDHMVSASSDYVQLMIFGYRAKRIPVGTIFLPEGGHPWAKDQIEGKILDFLLTNRLGDGVAVPAAK